MKYNSPLLKHLLSVTSGLLLFLSLPAQNLFFLAWFALIPVLFATNKSSAKEAFYYGLLAGLSAYLPALYWIFPTINLAGGGVPQAVLCLLLMAIYLALFIALWLMCSRLKIIENAKGYWVILFLAFLWVIAEYLRSNLLTGFPWILLGHSQWNFNQLIQISEFFGVEGISFLLVFFNLSLWSAIKEKKIGYIYTALSLALLVILVGTSLDTQKYRTKISMKVAVVQTNISQKEKWNPNLKNEMLHKYSNFLNGVIANSRPDLIVWPETALPDDLSTKSEYFTWASRSFGASFAYNVVGALISENGFYFNATAVFNPSGELVGVHKKTHLVPFGEYIPFRKYIQPFFPMVGDMGDFSKGLKHEAFLIANIPVSPTICSENFSAKSIASFVGNGAQILLNQTNDMWFYDTSALQQHFILNVFRAVENRRPVIVAGNGGISGFIDESGEIYAVLPKFVNATLAQRVCPCNGLTFYTRFPGLFNKIALLALFFLLYFRITVLRRK